jgi:hypothetical protein
LALDRLGRRRNRLRGRPVGRKPAGSGAIVGDGGNVVFVVTGELLELLDGVDDLSDVEEGVALEPDVDEGRLHPGEHLRHPPFVDVADHAALILALDEDFDDLVVLEYGDARVVRPRGDDHLLVHCRNSNCGRARKE